MKLHEKAKEMSVKAGELLVFLQGLNQDIRGVNQQLSDNQLTLCDSFVKKLESGKEFLCVAVSKDNQLKLLKIQMP